MSVDDSCRLCKESLRVKGTLTNTKKTFDSKKVTNEKSVNERLIELGLTLSKDNSKSGRICRSCLRLLRRIEDDFAIFRRWQEAEKETIPEASTSTEEKQLTCEAAGLKRSRDQTIWRVEKLDREPTASKMPRSIKKVCPKPSARKLSRPTTSMPARRSLTEVIIHYPSHPKGDKIVCQANAAGIVENITKKNWRTAANLIVAHKELFGQLKENILKVIEEESKILCNPHKGFMLWRSSAGDLKTFSFANLQSDLQRMSPFIFSIFSQITSRSPHSTCAAAAIALRGREPRLSAFAYYVDSVLQYGGAKKAVFKRLSKLGITTSYTCAVGKQKELANACGKGFQLLKVEDEIFNSQKEDGDTDTAEGGGAVQGVENTGRNMDAEGGVVKECTSGGAVQGVENTGRNKDAEGEVVKECTNGGTVQGVENTGRNMEVEECTSLKRMKMTHSDCK